MKAKLEFDLPEEQLEFQDAVDGSQAKRVIERLFDSIKWKDDAESDKQTTVGEMCEWFREEIARLIEEYEIRLD